MLSDYNCYRGLENIYVCEFNFDISQGEDY